MAAPNSVCDVSAFEHNFESDLIRSGSFPVAGSASCKANNEIVVFCRITNNTKIKADRNVYVKS